MNRLEGVRSDDCVSLQEHTTLGDFEISACLDQFKAFNYLLVKQFHKKLHFPASKHPSMYIFSENLTQQLSKEGLDVLKR